MRSEQEMLQLILDYTSRDDNIRVVLLNGSRANPNAPRDPFQDFDILCLVREMAPTVRNLDIPALFGVRNVHGWRFGKLGEQTIVPLKDLQISCRLFPKEAIHLAYLTNSCSPAPCGHASSSVRSLVRWHYWSRGSLVPHRK